MTQAYPLQWPPHIKSTDPYDQKYGALQVSPSTATIEWVETNGDFKDFVGVFNIECGSGGVFWAFYKGAVPIGNYDTLQEAKDRCETIKIERSKND